MSATAAAPPPDRLPGLTGLRGVAAVWVVLYHAFYGRGIFLIRDGYLPVDIFFLMSGFVLAHVYLPRRERLTARAYLHFLMVRLVRIYPLHLATLLLLLVLAAGLPGFATRDRAMAAQFGPGAFAANLFLVQNWGLWRPLTWNIPAWSLSAEWFGYLWFPVLILGVRRIAGRDLLLALAACVMFGFVAALYAGGFRDTSVLGWRGEARMLAEVSAGCLLCAAFAGGWRLPPWRGTLALAVILLAGGSFESARLLLAFAAPLAVVLAADGRTLWARGLSLPPVFWLGEISYSIYLVHWIAMQTLSWPGIARYIYVSEWQFTLVNLLVILLLSAASYRWVERPARAWGRKRARAWLGGA